MILSTMSRFSTQPDASKPRSLRSSFSCPGFQRAKSSARYASFTLSGTVALSLPSVAELLVALPASAAEVVTIGLSGVPSWSGTHVHSTTRYDVVSMDRRFGMIIVSHGSVSMFTR